MGPKIIDEARGPLQVLAGNSFKLMLRAFAAATVDLVPPTSITFGPSLLLAAQVAQGLPADLLISADLRSAQSVAPPGGMAIPFAADALSAVARPEIGLTTARFLERLLSDRVRIGIETPGAHTAANLAWQMFDRADAASPGAGAALRAKARVVTLPQESGRTGTGRWSPRQAMELIGSGEVDVVLNTQSCLRTLSRVADVVAPPPELAVSLTSGLVVLATASSRKIAAEAYVAQLLGESGRAMLARHGFELPPAD